MPEPRWIVLPRSERRLHPLFDPLTPLYHERPGRDLPAVTPETCVEHQVADTFTVDPESAQMVFEYEADRLIDLYHDGGFAPSAAVDFYLRFGTVALAAGRLDELANTIEHARRLQGAGLGPATPAADLLGRSISDREHEALKASHGSPKAVSAVQPCPAAPQGDLFAGLAIAA